MKRTHNMTYDGRGFVCSEFLQVNVLDEICERKGIRGGREDREGSEIMLPLRMDDEVAYARVRERAERRAFRGNKN
jgi:hypothetical protein